jgi:hypothetical protein
VGKSASPFSTESASRPADAGMNQRAGTLETPPLADMIRDKLVIKLSAMMPQHSDAKIRSALIASNNSLMRTISHLEGLPCEYHGPRSSTSEKAPPHTIT